MRQQNAGTDGSVALPPTGGRSALSERLASVTARVHESVPGERWESLAARLRAIVPSELSARQGQVALTAITLSALLVVVFASAGSSILVPRSAATYPSWEAGPLGGLLGQPTLSQSAARVGYSIVVVLMVGAYVAALLAVRSLSMRVIWAFVLVTAAVLLLGPPLQLNDVWNYLGYARLGALHHLNPYVFTMRAESNDPIYTFATWRSYPSPYGPLFTELSYPLAFLPIPVAYWLVKILIVGTALAFVWTVGWCARLLGRDPRFAILFVAANPIFVFYAVGGFHNDFLMLLPSTAAIGLLLQRRDRLAGAVLMLAVAVKPTAIVLLPFLLIAARPPDRRPRVIAGCVMAAVPLLAISVALFGFSMPNLSDQSRLITGFSLPNVAGIVLGAGGASTDISRLANLVLVLVILLGLRRRDWLTGAGWATVALIASVSWLMPWYVVWALPLACFASSRALRRTLVVLTVYLVLAFIPSTGPVLSGAGIQLMGGAPGRASLALQERLQGL